MNLKKDSKFKSFWSTFDEIISIFLDGLNCIRINLRSHIISDFKEIFEIDDHLDSK